MVSDVFVITGFGLIDPILAIFIKGNITGGTIFSAGLASTLFLITKSLVQLPFSSYVDRSDGKRRWLIVGTLMIAVVPFLYLSAKDVGTIYLAQVFHGVGSGLAFPTWLGLWSTHLDRRHESYEWSLYSTMTGIGTALSAAVGAAVAQFLGFAYSFIMVGALSLVGSAILFYLPAKDGRVRPEEMRRKI